MARTRNRIPKQVLNRYHGTAFRKRLERDQVSMPGLMDPEGRFGIEVWTQHAKKFAKRRFVRAQRRAGKAEVTSPSE